MPASHASIFFLFTYKMSKDLDDHVYWLITDGLVDVNTSKERIDYFVTLYNEDSDSHITTRDFIAAIKKFYTRDFEMRNEEDFFDHPVCAFNPNRPFSPELYNDSERLMQAISHCTNALVNEYCDKAMCVTQTTRNKWDVIIKTNDEESDQNYVIRSILTRTAPNKFKFTVTGYDPAVE